jgi:hypothetical protein
MFIVTVLIIISLLLILKAFKEIGIKLPYCYFQAKTCYDFLAQSKSFFWVSLF